MVQPSLMLESVGFPPLPVDPTNYVDTSVACETIPHSPRPSPWCGRLCADPFWSGEGIRFVWSPVSYAKAGIKTDGVSCKRLLAYKLDFVVADFILQPHTLKLVIDIFIRPSRSWPDCAACPRRSRGRRRCDTRTTAAAPPPESDKSVPAPWADISRRRPLS